VEYLQEDGMRTKKGKKPSEWDEYNKFVKERLVPLSVLGVVGVDLNPHMSGRHNLVFVRPLVGIQLCMDFSLYYKSDRARAKAWIFDRDTAIDLHGECELSFFEVSSSMSEFESLEAGYEYLVRFVLDHESSIRARLDDVFATLKRG
jgi:hypothetical protein